MRAALLRTWIPAAMAGLLLSASFAPLEWGGAAWFAPALLLVAAQFASPRRAFAAGWLAGAIFWLTSIWWLTRVTFVGWFLLSLFCALFVGAWAMAVSVWLRRFGVQRFLPNLGLMALAAAGWAGLEYVRSTLWTGFPWNPLGLSQYQNLAIIQIASMGGVYLVSALVVWASAGAGLTILRYLALRGRWGRRPHLELMTGVLAVALAFVYGARVVKQRDAPGARLRVALIQPNIPQDEKWDQAKTDLIYRRLGELTEAALMTRPELVIWPETALPDELRSSPASFLLVRDLATNGAPILVGTMDAELRNERPAYLNSSILVNERGVMDQVYDKRHLVPFGEYVPMQNLLPFMQAMTPIRESFSAGRTSTVFDVRSARFAVLICFEDTVAPLARESVRNGARMLVNQTNDAWFDPSSASRQHMAQSVLRAVENRVPVVRSANSGVTCHIDRRGRVLDALEVGVHGLKITEARLAPDDLALTFYTRHGDWFAVLSLALWAGWLVVGRARGGDTKL